MPLRNRPFPDQARCGDPRLLGVLTTVSIHVDDPVRGREPHGVPPAHARELQVAGVLLDVCPGELPVELVQVDLLCAGAPVHRHDPPVSRHADPIRSTEFGRHSDVEARPAARACSRVTRWVLGVGGCGVGDAPRWAGGTVLITTPPIRSQCRTTALTGGVRHRAMITAATIIAISRRRDLVSHDHARRSALDGWPAMRQERARRGRRPAARRSVSDPRHVGPPRADQPSPTSLRRLSSARCSRDLTVPAGRPRVSAVSASDSSSR